MFIKNCVLVIVLLVFCSKKVLVAQDNHTAGFPLMESYNTLELGFQPQNWDATSDTNGVMFFCNQGGVLKFDSVNWIPIDIQGRCSSISTDYNGRIFVGGIDDFGYLDKKADNIDAYKSLRHLIPDSIHFERIWSIIAHGKETYFQSNKYLFKYSGERISVHKAPSRFQSVSLLNDQIIVKSSGEGLMKFSGMGLTKYEGGERSFFLDNFIVGVKPLGTSSLSCSRDSGCYFLEDGILSKMKFNFDQSLFSNGLSAYEVLLDGTILIGTFGNGLIHVKENGELIRKISIAEGLIDNSVYKIFEDINGKVWVLTSKGISLIEFDVPLYIYDDRIGLKGTVWFSVETEFGFFVSTNEGVFKNSGSGFNLYPEVKNICTDYAIVNGGLFLACIGRLYSYELRSDSFYEPKANSILDISIVELFESNQKLYVVAGEKAQIVRIEDKKLDLLLEFEEILRRPNSIAVSKSSTIWLGTENGVYRLVVDSNLNHYQIEHLDSKSIPVFEGRVTVKRIDGEVYFFTSQGLYFFNEKLSEITRNSRFDDFIVNSDVQVFMGGGDERGSKVFRVDGKYLFLKKQKNKTYKPSGTVLERIDFGALTHLEVDKNDNAWISTTGGLLRFDANNGFASDRSYKIDINKVSVPETDSIIIDFEPLKFKENNLRFIYASSSYDAPERTTYRTKLLNIQEEWSSWTNETQKDFTFIQEGDYIFQVQAKNVYGTLSNIDSFSFTILPPWYHTWWAYTLYAFTIGLILYTGYKIRLNQVLKVQRVRNRIADDLHDDVTGTLVGISNFANAAQMTQDEEARTRFINLIKETADDTKEKITDIVWAINPEHDDWQSFLAKCRRYASDIFESSGIEYEIDIVESIAGKLAMDLRQNFWLIYKEIITNIVKHSQANSVFISINVSGNVLVLVARDDGEGFNTGLQNSGNGISNINKRAKQVGAETELNTEMNKGTIWTIRFSV